MARGGLKDVRDALPIWVASSGMEPGRFRALLVGKGFGVKAAASLQAMAQVLARAGDGGSGERVKVAGEHLVSDQERVE